jgi:hypothetical protein
LLLAFAAGQASTDHPLKDSSTLIITLHNPLARHSTVDSVYLIFDRYDRRGAGVIKGVFYPENNTIRIVIPKGKYYVNIFCLGIYSRECFDRILNAKPNKKQCLLIKLQTSDLYTPGLVTIPQEKIDPSRLSIFRFNGPK